jgi:isoleucyl-tRNA synthetase
VPYLLKFIDNLTNIYVRFNRKRLKGRTGEVDCMVSLSTLYHVSNHCVFNHNTVGATLTLFPFKMVIYSCLFWM